MSIPRCADRSAAILIAGPTASGKSALATALARRYDGVVINTDSMQVYADLRRLTARPDADDEHAVPHRLYGHVDGALNYSAGHFAREVRDLLTRLDGCFPIFVGGTGLYFRALEEGLSEMPPVPEHVRRNIRTWAEPLKTQALHAELVRLDPGGAAKLRPSDRARVLRALEIQIATGRPIADFQQTRTPGPLADFDLQKIFLAPDRDQLRKQIDLRFRRMIHAGALAEVETLRDRRLDPLLPIMRAHGVPGLIAHLEGTMTLEEAIVRGQADTRRYAKRQFTWFRHQMGPGWQWLMPEAATAALGFSAPDVR
nr:tRNA (adenosine(37)-N6)-dimethylallyltransferase MiaA [Methylobacterium planeticum]